jgi:nucleoside-diphosphate-sugar epimerase
MLLVTGATGFIGSHLVERVDGPVKCLVRRAAPLPHGRGSVSTVRGDLASGTGLDEALDGVDTVIHLAGATKVLRPGDYYTGNARATENLARRTAGRPIRFVHVSSLAAAGPSLDGAPVTEDDPPHPVSHYGKSKLEAEQVVRSLLPDAVIVRPPVVYGPRDTDVFHMLQSVARGLFVQIAGGDRWFSAIYVEDLVEGILAAARAPQAAGRTYFLSHPKPRTWGDLAAAAGRIMNRQPRRLSMPVPAAVAVGWCAEMWARAAGKPGIVSRDKIAEARFEHWTCATGRAKQELGFDARTSLEDGLARTLAWYKEAGWIKY